LPKQKSPKASTDDGITMLSNPLPWNASRSIRNICDIDSTAIDTNDLQFEKHPGPSASTDDGITMLFNPLPENAHSSIRNKCDVDSNVIDTDDLQL
jgi:hypothetical protein